MGYAAELQKAQDHLSFEFKSDQEQVSDQGGPDLNEHGVLGGPVKSFDFQVLLDTLERKFDVPAAAIKLGYLLGWHIQAVG